MILERPELSSTAAAAAAAAAASSATGALVRFVFILVFAVLVLGTIQTSAAESQKIAVDLAKVCFTVDVSGKSAQDAVFYTANGNNVAFMVYPSNDPNWSTIRTPDEALRNAPTFPLKPGERMVTKLETKVKRADGAWCVKLDYKIAGSSPRDDPQANTSWHISRYVYIGNRIIIMQGCWFKNGDIDQDYRTFDLITETVTAK